jgi:hypothetical protein
MADKLISFEKWWENEGYFQCPINEKIDIVEVAYRSWEACKQETLKFLDRHVKVDYKGDYCFDSKFNEIVEQLKNL